jgi:hypothetical protein
MANFQPSAMPRCSGCNRDRGDSSTESLAADFDLANIATSFSAVPRGNLTGNGFSLVHHTFGLVFCSTDPGGDTASCPNSTTNMTFSYFPGLNDTNYAQAIGFSRDYPAWVDTIKINALNAYKAAFENLPGIVRAKEAPNMLYGGSTSVTSFEHTVYISGYWIPPGVFPRLNDPYPPNGYTPLQLPPFRFSWVYYLPVMGNTQIGLGNFSSTPFIPLSPIYSPPPISQALNTQFQQLVAGLGSAIGRISVHETGHQLALPNMECSSSCQDNDQYVYEFYSSAGTEDWWYTGKPALHWSKSAQCALQQYLLPGSKCP